MGGIGSTIARGLGDVATFGTNELVGNPIGRETDYLMNGPKKYTPQQIAMQGNDPMSVLTSTGGAPLLAQVSMGADVHDAIAAYFGKGGGAEFDKWLGAQDGATQDAVHNIQYQLKQVQSNSDLQNQTIQKLVNDFPNYMQTMAPKYASIMSDATKQMMDQAIQGAAAKYAAGGQVSSGAMNEAAAKIGAQYGQSNIESGINLANQDWLQQYTEANALRTFQQKMLGQGAQNGFSAQQNALQRQMEIAGANTGAINQANAADIASQNQFSSNLLGLAGTAVTYGLMRPGPVQSPTPTPNTSAPTPFPQGQSSMNMPLNYPSPTSYSSPLSLNGGGYR